MEASRQQRVLAVGIDSAEPTLIRELIDHGELPALRSLLDRGHWALVDSGADIGSGAVWPTFFTGTGPSEHEMYSGWQWKPEEMACAVVDESFFVPPFWASVVDSGETVGVIDVPWAPVAGIKHGFELSEWGPHEGRRGRPHVAPARARHLAARRASHPFYAVPYGPGQAEDRAGKQRLSSACVAGARLRGDLAVDLISETHPALSIVVFPEVHHASHHLWQTMEPDHSLYARYPEPSDEVEPGLVEIYRAVDHQLGRILEAAGPDTAVMAFSLHGMKPGPGIPWLLEPLLESLRFAAPAGWPELSWRGRAAALFGAAKRRAPASLRRIYYRRTSFAVRQRMARSTIMAPHDWSRTRAFSLPSDQRGYIRINLAGREAAGIVSHHDYGAVCDELADELRKAESADGEALVKSVLRTTPSGAAATRHLPDLVVEWDDAAFARPVRIASGSTELECYPIRTDMTGQHAPRGFCIADERLGGEIDELIAGKDLHRPLLAAVGAEDAPVPS
jgi:predicted AlkP superfamily phosphohydrolase/phosphomutase